jgi:hypothetical protein
MNFNLVSKNNLGAATALLLVVILSQGRFLNFLLDTALGRAILILFILFISYTNKILGVVSVLFIIIMFNNSNIGYMEGATTMGSTMDPTMASTMKKDDGAATGAGATGAATTGAATTGAATTGAATTGAATNGAATTTAATTTATGGPATGPLAMKQKKPVEGYEGFNLLETERQLFNKKANSIPATAKTEGFEGVEPYSGSNEQYAQF